MKFGVLTTVLMLMLGSPSLQSDEYAPENENVIHRTTPGRQLFKEDVQCGGYFWRSDKADRSGAITVYYFYGSTDWGKGKIGLYRQALFDVVVDENKEPPTAQLLTDSNGNTKAVRIRMTSREWAAAARCFAGKARTTMIW